MRITRISAYAVLIMFFAIPIQCLANETIVFVRHGEKLPGGYGQMSCQGLNRALALPSVLAGKFGKPDYIIAPDPSEQMTEGNGKYYYVRPLATIEPTAIHFGLPVQTPFGWSHINELQTELTAADMGNSVIFVAWEHHYLRLLVENLLKSHGADASVVPEWPENDYDSIYVVKLSRDGSEVTASFEADHENLNGQKASCPN